RNPVTRNEIEQLYAKHDFQELSARLLKRISFGTAGLRANMAAGFSRMNDLTVIQASQGLAAYLLKEIKDSTKKGIIIGHDHRHNSERFASVAAVAFLRQGFTCYLLKGPVATPLVPFGTKYLGTAAGVMITASHNPAADNGYKLYYANAVQIIPPYDVAIAASIEQHVEVDDAAWDLGLIDRSRGTLCIDRTLEVHEKYFQSVAKLAQRSREKNNQTALTFIYTPMHGVGLSFATRAFIQEAGFPKKAWIPVDSQKDPDPNFSTVKFPNPEEKGALDLAMKAGELELKKNPTKTVMILANDPDADRFGAAEWTGSKWHVFSGDQIGTILGVWIFQAYKDAGKPVDQFALLASTASSKLLAEVAYQEGFVFKETLTGFKYLGNEALELEKLGYHVPFAYEEALGYMCGTEIRDKDGLTALVIWAEIASELKDRGSSVIDYLDTIYRKYGYFATNNGYHISQDPAAVEASFNKLRFGTTTATYSSRSAMLQNLRFPKTLAGYPIESIRDLTIAYDSSHSPEFLPDLPCSSAQMITLGIGGEDGKVVATLRTSGTETWKLKYYVEGSAPEQVVAQQKVDNIVKALAVLPSRNNCADYRLLTQVCPHGSSGERKL
ncbi:hypothetical protein O181_025162, partial [Austropuccinia psidii MF-1]|nr:hypothetical protein [Austropuccinia psidii MF-1]